MFHFVANLKPYTFYRGRGNRRFDAYLLSVDYASQQSDIAKLVVSEDRALCADNGNFYKIGELIEQFKSSARSLDTARKAEEKQLSVKYAKPGQLSAGLRNQYQSLANEISQASVDSTADGYVSGKILEQFALQPKYMIGMEDFTIATMTALNIEPEYAGLPTSFYDDRVNRALTFAVNTSNGDYGTCNCRVFAGLHAMDFDTAYAAGVLAAQTNVDGIATGLVGALRDKNYVDFRIQNGQLLELDRPTARPYMRVLEILTGLHAGYRSVKSANPEFHALGAGSPILLPLIGLLGDGQTFLGTDSTAPIMDGWTSPTTTLYVDEPVPLKLKAHKIAESWLDGGRGWDCTCPYCRQFSEEHPVQIGPARSWWVSEGRPSLTKYDLYRDRPLSQWFPILSRFSDTELQTQAALARVSHNHWVLKRLESRIRYMSSDSVGYRAWVAEIMERYEQSSTSPGWRESARQAWEIASAYSVANY